MRSINQNKNLLTTPLYQWHCSHNANMAEFGDFILPLWYEKGARAEHLAVLTSAGVFDTSHMTALVLKGDDSFTLLQHFFSRDLGRWGKTRDKSLPIGKGVYGVFLNSDGCLLDDSIVFRVAESTYFICVNSGKGDLIQRHLNAFNGSYTTHNLTGSLTKIDLQGPNSAKILARIISGPENIFEKFPPFSCKGSFAPHFTTGGEITTLSGIPLLIARSGYTGEFGFEIFSGADTAQALWKEIISAGEPYEILPCGLAARDSLRTGAGLPLAGHDIGNWPFVNNPWLFALPFITDKDNKQTFSKQFFGSESLLKAEPSYTYAFAGYDLRKVDSETATVTNADDESIGKVLTCVTDMAIGRINQTIVSINSTELPDDFKPRGLSCGFLKTASPLAYGEKIVLQDAHRKIEAEIVKTIRPDCTARFPLQHFL